MLRLIVQRVALAPLIVFGVVTLVFFTARLLPGDPLERFVTEDSDPQFLPRLRHQAGLDRPLAVQYASWVRGVALHRDFGQSWTSGRAVSSLVAEALPNTVRLAGLAFALRWTLAVVIGVASAVRRGRRLDTGVRGVTLLFDATPSFVLGVLLQLLFAYRLQWLPADSMRGLDAAALPFAARLRDALAHLVLPVAVLGVHGVAVAARYVRASVLESMSLEHVRAARARGLLERTILWRHVCRNGVAPVVTLLALSIPGLVGGSLIVETLFAWPGMGRLTAGAALTHDQPVLLATTMLAATLVVGANLAADVAAAFVDPRLRREA